MYLSKIENVFVTCQMFQSYPNLNQLSALLCFNCKMFLSKIDNLIVKMHNVFLAQSDVRCSDLIPILTSCLRSFPAVKAFWRKLKARWQSYENQIGIGELLLYQSSWVYFHRKIKPATCAFVLYSNFFISQYFDLCCVCDNYRQHSMY